MLIEDIPELECPSFIISNKLDVPGLLAAVKSGDNEVIEAASGYASDGTGMLYLLSSVYFFYV